MRTTLVLCVAFLLIPSIASSDTLPKAGSLEDAFRQTLSLATKGDTNSQVCLSEMYAMGLGAHQDLETANKWSIKAADNGNKDGILMVANMYINGSGVKKDPKKGFATIRSMAKQGYPGAANTLGWMYLEGRGVQKDYKLALKWFQTAVTEGDLHGDFGLMKMYENGWGVKADPSQRQRLIENISVYQVDCIADYWDVVTMIIGDNITTTKRQIKTRPPTQTMAISFMVDNKKAVKPTIINTSGVPEYDNAILDTISNTPLPPWPAPYNYMDKTIFMNIN